MTVVIVGAGSAGLSVSSELRVLGMEHVVLERHRVGQAWRDRWDSFTLVTPNWTLEVHSEPTVAAVKRALGQASPHNSSLT